MSNTSAHSNPVVDAVKRHLGRSDRVHVPLPAVPSRPERTDDLVRQFADQLSAVGGHCWISPDLPHARAHLQSICASHGLSQIARSDSPLIEAVLKDGIIDTTVEQAVENREILFAADAGVTEAQWGIAETGTLVLASAAERHRLTSLVPPMHIAVVAASRIVATMPAVLRQFAEPGLEHRAVTFITGPSRTADIELTLVVGVHGPKELHVIVLQDR